MGKASTAHAQDLGQRRSIRAVTTILTSRACEIGSDWLDDAPGNTQEP